jgi:hypothetical protein
MTYHDGESREAFDTRVIGALIGSRLGAQRRTGAVVTHGGGVRAPNATPGEPLAVLGNCEIDTFCHHSGTFSRID